MFATKKLHKKLGLLIAFSLYYNKHDIAYEFREVTIFIETNNVTMT